ncbi:RloB family protein [Spirillospora sp. NPDC048911]|uniref:RloB family protein n=1 Tax=Spirillospora sp. NPDC048911 TaxID=3364527 RepID=UPI00371C49F0
MSPRTPKPSGRRVRDKPFDSCTDLARRPGGSRVEQTSFLILCEGKTEKLYFTGMRTRRGPQLAVDAPDRDHLGVVREAIARRTDEYDEVWCVLDTELDEALVTEIVREACAGGVKLALSSPCFEVWLILHHEVCAAPFQSAEQAKKKLAQVLPGWSETTTRFADFKKGVQDACQRARPLSGDADDLLQNPSTNVWRLAELILNPPNETQRGF